ncbi:Sua5 YciO YrdC YwlC family protein [uncultured Helicobacter sp.]|uniref:Sua5 YciO YrdC YwlC family protein n=1 Tax=uncultured Helicobacter sp. TaxID=175537 RepID=UPI00374F3B4A
MSATTANNTPLILAQTDTTIGFLCESQAPIDNAKHRHRHTLRESRDFATLRTLTRIPKSHRRLVRRSRRVSFVYPSGCGVRVVASDSRHQSLLGYYPLLFSSSANRHTKSFDSHYALQVCDMYVLDSRGWSDREPSTILRLGKHKKQKIR